LFRGLAKAVKTGLGQIAQSGLGKALEFELQRKLNQAWIGISVVGRDLAKSVVPGARRGTVESGSRNTKLGVIEQIEEFRSEFETISLAKDYAFEYSPIEVIDSWRSEDRVHASLRAITPVRWRREAVLIEPIGERVSA